MVKPFIILFLLGALQGAVGWIMVASGLTGDATYVKPTRLALHFIFALGLLCYTFWFALLLLIKRSPTTNDKPARTITISLLGILGLQLIYGALMAGNKAAAAAPTWPDINGEIVPEKMMIKGEGFYNFLDNRVVIHFIHRGLAYIILLLAILLTIYLYKVRGSLLLTRTKFLPLSFVCFQVLLGILTVVNGLKVIPNTWGIFEWLALAHQVVAMLLLLSLVWILYLLPGTKLKPINP